MKTQTFYTTVIASAVTLSIVLLWSPWLPKNGGQQHLKAFRQSETFITVAEAGVGDIYCKGVEVAWAPFGRKITYCDHAVWRMGLTGTVTLSSFTKYQPSVARNEAVRTFAYFKDNTAHQMCRAWNLNDSVPVVATYLGTDEPALPNVRETKSHFSENGREFFLVFPYEEIMSAGLKAGERYTVDMNNLCIFEHHFQKAEPMDQTWLKYIMPVPAPSGR